MAKSNRVHFGNESKARDFARCEGGKFHENKGNTEKPFTVSFQKESNQRNEDFGSDINGNGTDWHTSEDL
ncbi:hypothetical protein ACR79N_15990 [Sphingobacterium siyangense]|uniref:hypothetical protein n=1 Tax=Sphingobacterium siyangense TaxID=459529 RepID=UPI003DA30D9A